MAGKIPDDIRQFLIDSIDSVAELELLLLLKSDPQRTWTAADVSRTLYTTPEMSAAQLALMQSRKLFAAADAPEKNYHYAPATPEIDRVVTALETVYHERRVAVITLIYSKPVDKVRTFADAFRLRKEK